MGNDDYFMSFYRDAGKKRLAVIPIHWITIVVTDSAMIRPLGSKGADHGVDNAFRAAIIPALTPDGRI
jgi:hypothetical protein